MIEIINISKDKPYQIFKNFYDQALLAKQKSVEAICISSFNFNKNEVESRFVNLKYIIENEWTFFSNYRSSKAIEFKSHDQISALFYWRELNLQIRLKSKIYKSSSILSDNHFQKRTNEKNALAISSYQSRVTSSYNEVEDSYLKTLSKINDQTERPDYWGGFTFIPYYFEFWQGHDNRLNKRNVFKQEGDEWIEQLLQP
jgi:pyridoxamine 5'-phosphate oxidase